METSKSAAVAVAKAIERMKILSKGLSTSYKRISFSTKRVTQRSHTVSQSDTGHMTNTFNSLALDTSERGAATAEYAIATVAAAGFAGLLAIVLKSNPVQSLLTDLISGALSIVT